MIESDELVSQAYKDNIESILAGALIFKDEKLLIVKRAETEDFLPGLYEIPSGHIEKNESLLEGLERELFEETGLKMISVDQFVNYFDYRSKSGKKKRQFNYCVSVSGEIVLNPLEHSSFFWMNRNDIIKLDNISDQTKEVIKEAYNIERRN